MNNGVNPPAYCSTTSGFQIQDIAVCSNYGHYAYINSNKSVNIFNPDCSQNSSLLLNYSTAGAKLFLSYTFVIVTF